MKAPFKAGPFRMELDADGNLWALYRAGKGSNHSMFIAYPDELNQLRRLIEKVRKYRAKSPKKSQHTRCV